MKKIEEWRLAQAKINYGDEAEEELFSGLLKPSTPNEQHVVRNSTIQNDEGSENQDQS